jgi:hypothetical protein
MRAAPLLIEKGEEVTKAGERDVRVRWRAGQSVAIDEPMACRWRRILILLARRLKNYWKSVS